MGVDGVAADAQNLSVPVLELFEMVFETLDLGLSAAGEVEDIEGEDHLRAPELAEGIRIPAVPDEGEVRGGLARLGGRALRRHE